MEQTLFRSWAEVSLSQIAQNFLNVRKTVGAGVEVMAVVKSEAYGHGAAEVSRTLEANGARWLAVGNTAEGAALRRAGIRSRIFVMAECLPFDVAAMADFDLTPAVHSLEDLAELDRLAGIRGAPLRYHLKVDSGMGRLGTRAAASEILRAVRSASYSRIEGLMTHLASAGDYSSSQTDSQIGYFEALIAELRRGGVEPEWVHLASTIPVAYGRRAAFGNMVRAGLALYGYVPAAAGPAPPNALQVMPALNWKARVLALKEVPAGAPIGYGALFRAARPMKIAVLAAGYADGLPHQLSNKGRVIAKGRYAQIIGAVSMDLTTIDASDLAGLRPGDAVTLLGRDGGAVIDAEEIAWNAGTISYAVLCGIHPRVTRLYTQ